MRDGIPTSDFKDHGGMLEKFGPFLPHEPFTLTSKDAIVYV
jgi:hypothetical protein